VNIYCDPTKRHDFVLLFDVKNGNPNGDPDAGNMPRIDPETMHGLVTDVCIKRKIRDYVATVLGKPIFIQSGTALNTIYNQVADAARDENGKPVVVPVELKADDDPDLKEWLDKEEGVLADWLENLGAEGFDFDRETEVVSYRGELKNRKDFVSRLAGEEELSEEQHKFSAFLAAGLAEKLKKTKGKGLDRTAREIVKEDHRDKYFDIRMFGAVLTAGTNAGQIRGPVQITFAQSIDPIQPRDVSITRVAVTKPSDQLRKTTEMGRKAIVPYGLYRAHGFFNPLLGRRRKGESDWKQVVTESDLQDLWDALQHMFEFDRSAARGEMITRGLYIFTHDNDHGCARAHELFELVGVPKCGERVREFEEYRSGISVPKDGSLSDFPGVTLNRLVHPKSALAASPE
jgi:CRISPR-associated protein Csd2